MDSLDFGSIVHYIGSLRWLTTSYWGIVVATLPFTPLSMLTVTTHSGLNGDNFNECNVVFIYGLCNMIFRANIQQFLGSAPRRNLAANANNIFNMPLPEEVEEELKTLQ